LSRRASDKAQARMTYILLALAIASSALAAVVSFKAIRAVDGLNALLEDASRVRRNNLVPEGY